MGRSKRGSTDLSCVIGIDKPLGLSSHDVVNRCRVVLGERRIGHAGTLDPQATGVLPILVGPAARLDRYLTGHRKAYVARIAFGTATSTDDAEGEPIKVGPLTPELSSEPFARSTLASFLGPQRQIPPVYSAIKVNGVRSYAATRKGAIIDLEPRDIVVHEAELLDIDDADGMLSWAVRFDVSKGTYIRALARDVGRAVGVPAHLSGLRRECVGELTLDGCINLETLAEVGTRAALDPVKLLGYPVGFVAQEARRAFDNGNRLAADGLSLFEYAAPSRCAEHDLCACTSGLHPFSGPLEDGMLVSVVSEGALKAIYRYVSAERSWRSDCTFSKGVSRGPSL